MRGVYRHVTTFITDTGILIVRLRRTQRNGGVGIGENLLECRRFNLGKLDKNVYATGRSRRAWRS